MATQNYRTINIDLLDPDSPANFDLSALRPSVEPISTQQVQENVNQIRQVLRSGDSEGALRAALEGAPYGADAKGKDIHTTLTIEILQSIRATDMTPLLNRLYASTSPSGPELLDVLVKYLYKGMGASHNNAVSGAGGANSKQQTPQSTGGFSQMGGRTFGGAGGGGGAEMGGQAMSVLLSWHEKVVEVAGMGAVVRCMSDRRTV